MIFGSGQGEHADGAIARACMGFLENYDSDKPFFLNAGFMNPHDCCYTAGANGGQGKFRFAEDIAEQLPPLPENFTPPVKGSRVGGWSASASPSSGATGTRPGSVGCSSAPTGATWSPPARTAA